MTDPRLPDAGDLYWTVFDPVVGSEQAGRRPCVVLSRASYHLISGRMLVCPVTRHAGTWAFNVPLPQGAPIVGAIMVDQARVIDRVRRPLKWIGNLDEATLQRVRTVLASFAGMGT